MIKSRRMKWAGHVARTGEIRNIYIYSENLKARDHLADLDVVGRSILKRVLRE
jgi:hypothetical protein